MEKKDKELYQRLKEFLDLKAISRHEEAVVEKLKENLNSNLEYQRDGLGSIIFSQKNKKANTPLISVVAHMDEVGYYIQDILDNGQLRISPIGGLWPLTVIGTKAIVINDEAKEFPGVFGHTSIHILEKEKVNKAPLTTDLFVDLGFSSKKEVEQNKISVANQVYLTGEAFVMNKKYVVGKAMDNRAGVLVIDQLLQRLAQKDLNCQMYLAGSVQEEVGTRGAKTIAQILKSDISIAIDTCAAHDTYKAIKGIQKLGEGAALRIKDGGTIMDPKLVNWILEIAKEKNIKAYKYVAQGGGTDAAALQYGNKGVATITISLPQRYLHSPLGVCHIDDIKAAIDLIEQIILKLNSKTYQDKIAYQ